jgi:hypothetical protein
VRKARKARKKAKQQTENIYIKKPKPKNQIAHKIMEM